MVATPPSDAAGASPGASGRVGPVASLRRERLRSHRLSAPAPTIAEAAAHMLATQAQEFWGGRLALAARTRGAPTLRDVDAAFDRGEIVRSWTMRGTIHIIPARDLAWVLSVTGRAPARQGRARASRRGDRCRRGRPRRACRARGAPAAATASPGRTSSRCSRPAGVSTAGQRGYHLLYALATRLVLCQGPVVSRAGGPSREQLWVLFEEWITDAASPADPLAEYFFRYIASHGPAGARDFAWWSGLPLGMSRAAAEAASDRLHVVDDDPEPQYVVAGPAPRRSSAAPDVVALPPFEEYYLSYVDRTVPCAPEFLRAIGPAMNGIVRPILVARGEIVGVWTHSVAVGRHTDDPIPELFSPDAATDAEIGAALDRYRAFITG